MTDPYQMYPPYQPYPPDYYGPEPDYYDPPRTTDSIDPMDKTSQYVNGLSADVDSSSTGGHSHHRHHHHHRHSSHISPTAPPLTIRRHAYGSSDPSLQTLPTNVQSTSDNITASNLRVTIKRNPIIPEPDQTFIQPVLYPVAVYVNNPPSPQNFAPPPFQPVQPVQPIQPIQAIKEVPKPPSPKKSPTPPSSSSRYETESFQLPPPPPSRPNNKNVTPRRPIIIDVVATPAPPKLEPQKVRPSQVIVEEYDEHNDYYRVPSVYTIPKKVISYRTTKPGLSTREVENERMENVGEDDYIQSPPAQVVTYRT